MAKQTFTAGQVLTAAQVNGLQTNDFNLTVSTKTAAYTFVVGDRGTRVVLNDTTARTFTIDNSIFSAGDTIQVHNINTGVLTIAAGAGVTVNALTADLVQWQSATIFAISASSFIVFPSGGAVKTTKVDVFTASGTFTPAAGVTYAIAHILGGGGGVGTASSGNGGTSSVAFAGGTISATGGNLFNGGSIAGTPSIKHVAGVANSGKGAQYNAFRESVENESLAFIQAGDGAYIVAGGAVTPGTGITVTVGAGGTAGTSGAAGGSGYVWIEYEV